MRVPRHYLSADQFPAVRQMFITTNNNWGSKPLEQMIYCPDGEGSQDFFYDTNRGRDQINDCLHSKVVSPLGDKMAAFCNLRLPNGNLGVPQRSWESGLEKVQYSYRGYYFYHKYVWIPALLVYRPVLLIWEWDFRCDGRGGWPYSEYGIWAAHCKLAYAFTATVPSSAKDGYETIGYDGWVTYTVSGDSPLKINSYSDRASKLPEGYYVPSTSIPSRIGRHENALVLSWTTALNAAFVAALQYVNIVSARKYRLAVKVASDPVLPPQSRGNFLFNEDLMIMDHLPDQVIRNPNVYWRNWLVQHAYLSALQSVPTLSDNSISNIIEIVGFIKALVVDRKIEIPKRLQDAWLSYRYSYSTSKMDFKEAIAFMKRHSDLGTLDRELKCYGMSSTTVGDTEVLCQCTLSIKPTDLGYVGRIWRALETYGLTPDFYVIWDMIPYSFIVDWFIPVGDLLSVVDAERRFAGTNYSIKDVCFSLSYLRTIDTYCYKQYARWKSDPLETFNAFYWFDKPASSAKVKLFRVADTASLFIGG